MSKPIKVVVAVVVIDVVVFVKKNDDSVKEAPAYCRSFLDSLHS